MRLLYLLLVFLLSTFSSMAKSTPQVGLRQAQEFTYLVVAKDLTRHRVTLSYIGESWGDVYETGKAAHGLSLQDTRECHWRFWNQYRMQHEKTVDAKTGASERISDPLKLQQSQGFPLYAPYAQDYLDLGAQLNSWLAIQRLEKIWSSSNFSSVETAIATVPYNLIVSFPTVIIRAMAVVTGFRKGINCGEAASAIKANRENYQGVMKINMGVIPQMQYYLNATNLYRHWQYIDQKSGSPVGALFVYPAREWPDHMIASAKIWREIRQNMLVNNPTPNDAEVAEFGKLVARYPEDWMEMLVQRHAKRIDEKFFEDIRVNVVRDVGMLFPSVSGGPGLPKPPEPSDYVVTQRELPARMSPEYFGLDAKSQEKIDRCGHGRLYEIAFADPNMTIADRGQAEASLSRAVGNARTNMMWRISKLDWIASHLPKEHELQADIEGFAAKVAPRITQLNALIEVYNERNAYFRNCLNAKVKPPVQFPSFK